MRQIQESRQDIIQESRQDIIQESRWDKFKNQDILILIHFVYGCKGHPDCHDKENWHINFQYLLQQGEYWSLTIWFYHWQDAVAGTDRQYDWQVWCTCSSGLYATD